MTEFSEKCKELIVKSNISIYQLAKVSNLDRTTLQKMIKGERLASRQFVQEMCSHLRITKQEERDLMELYDMEKVGKDTYYTRIEIHKLLQEIQQICRGWESTDEEIYRVRQEKKEEKGVKIYKMQMDMEDALRSAVSEEVLTEEVPEIYMDTFKGNAWVMQQLVKEEKHTDKEIICHQYINFHRKRTEEDSEVSDIKKLKWILPFAITFQKKYDLRYSYIDGKEEDELLRLWPHYMVTTNRVLLVSGDEQRMMVISDKKIAKLYQEQIVKTSEEYRQLFRSQADYEKQDDWGMKEKVFYGEEGFCIEVCGKQRLLFGSGSKKGQFEMLNMEETGICQAFLDYFGSRK